MGDDNKYAGDKSGGGGLTPENKYAGDAPSDDAELTPENKYAGDKSGGDTGLTPEPGGTDAGATTDSSGDPASDPDSGISPANKYAG
jgi:hypothetical protein